MVSRVRKMVAKVQQDQEFIEYIVKSIVNHPEDVKTTRVVDEMGVLITLKINPEDMGYVIGREGQTAKVLRVLLRLLGARNNARLNLKIEEPEGGTRPAARGARGRGSAAGGAGGVEDLRL